MRKSSKYIAFMFGFLFLIGGVTAAWNLGFITGTSSTMFVSEGVEYVQVFETKTIDTTNGTANSSNTLLVFNPDGEFLVQVVPIINITDNSSDSCFIDNDYNVSIEYDSYNVMPNTTVTILPGSTAFEITTIGKKQSCPAQVDVILELIPIE